MAELRAEVVRLKARIAELESAKPPTDRKAYMRDYMAKRRAKSCKPQTSS